MRRFRGLVALAAALVSASGREAAGAEPIVVRIGTIAPEGTTWVRELRVAARAVEQRTGGAVRLKPYPGAVLGDEREMVRQMTLGRLEGAMLTTVGLEMAVPAMQVFHMPLLLDSFSEVDRAIETLRPMLAGEYARAGLVDAGTGPIGSVRVFSTAPATRMADLDRMRIWAWVDDPVQRQFFGILGQKTVPLSLPD
ncbi:MAG: TRAP transporter substrate-binding protein DctP, partial [Myxococcota bacterium]